MKSHIEIVPVRWFDKVLELALERLPTARPEEELKNEAVKEVPLPATVTQGVVKH